MTDFWMPLAEDNPIPGDPWALLNLATTLVGHHEVIELVVNDLTQIDSTGYWQSPAAAGFMEVRDEVLPNLRLLGARFERTTSALRIYSGHLNTAQETAESARLTAKAAESRIAEAERNLAQKTADAAALPPDPAAVPVFTGQDPDEIAIEEGRDQLSLAGQILLEAQTIRDGAAGACAREIGDAIDDDLRNDDGGLWGGIKRFSKNLVDNFPYVDDIARVAGLASGALGLLSLIPPLTPFLAPVAFAAGSISFLANSTLAADGEQGWSGATWDAIGIATFGVGRVATASSRMFAGRDLANRAAQLRALRLRESFSPFVLRTPAGAKTLRTARHLKKSAGVLGRAAKPFLDAAGKPMSSWGMLRSSAAFWRGLRLPSLSVLRVSVRRGSCLRCRVWRGRRRGIPRGRRGSCNAARRRSPSGRLTTSE